ncbi:copper resistance protein B [Sphingorhabdus sp. Alg239-R122]|uniref:copper resistance protein B n=1 Tax=Sphingorhabdus sp. Alg239-R122 TaxID=2305989 RepID=UPI0013DD2A49|nr:copper resistance protein B [Sphingorhabdus sp. Alg239-R122]
MPVLAAVLLVFPVTATAFAAQDHAQHQHHGTHEMPAPPEKTSEDALETDHSQMDHTQMDHGDHKPARPQNPSANAESGPIRAADAIWGADAMRPSREALYREHGNMQVFWFQGDRAEYRARAGHDGYLWDAQGYYGGDINKFWFKSEGEGSFGEAVEDAEVQALYSRAIAPFWDVQAGVRQDLAGPWRTHAVFGVQGIAPYMFEVDAAAFLSDKGNLTARIEAEYDQRLTQKLIVQPRIETNLSAQDIPELSIGAGIDNVELGLRLRYEITPEFAPYIGVEQEWKLSRSRNFVRAEGEDASVTNYVVGARFWF